MRRPHFSTIGYLMLNTLSAALAAGGFSAILPRLDFLQAMMGRVLPEGSIGLAQGVLSLALGAIIQLLLVAAWKSLFQERRVGYLVLGLVFSAVSALTSATTFVFLSQESRLTANLRQQNTAPVVEALQASASGFRDISEQTRALARQAAQLRRQEEVTGGTCSDVKTIPGPGPRMRLRARQATDFTTFSEQADKLAQHMLGLSLQIGRLPAAEAQVLYDEVVLYANSKEVRQLVNGLEEARAAVTDGFLDPPTGKRYTCQTPAFGEAIGQVLGRIRIAQTLKPRQIVEARAGLSDSLSSILADMRAWATGEVPEIPPVGRKALLAALLVEVLQVLMILTNHRQRFATGQVPSPEEAFMQHPRLLSPALRRLSPAMQAVLDNQTLVSGGRLWLVVPSGRRTEAERAVIQFFGLEESRVWRHSGAWRAVPLYSIAPDWVAERKEALPGSVFDLYPLPRRIWRWRRVFWRDTLGLEQADARATPD